MALTALHVGSNEAPHRLEIHLRRNAPKHVVENVTQSRSFRAGRVNVMRRPRHLDLHIVGAKLAVPQISGVTRVVETRIPLGHEIAEVARKDTLHIALELDLTVPFVLHV